MLNFIDLDEIERADLVKVDTADDNDTLDTKIAVELEEPIRNALN